MKILTIIIALLFCNIANAVEIGTIDPKEDISIKTDDNITLKGLPTGVKSIRTFSKPSMGHWVLIYNDKEVIIKQYVERGTIYYPAGCTEYHGTELEVNSEIKKLGLKTLNETEINTTREIDK